MTEIICTAITAVASVIVTMAGISIKKTSKEQERHSELRREESLLSLHMMDATLQLSVVTSNALTGGHNNGNIERARIAAQKAASDYEEFMRKATINEVCK